MESKWIPTEAEIKQYLMNTVFVQFLIARAKAIRVSRRYVISLYDVLNEYNITHRTEDTTAKSKAVAYNFTLAIFPSIIFLFTLIPYLPFEEYITVQEVLEFMKVTLPKDVWAFIGPTIEDIISRQRGGLLSFGFLLALWLATNGMYSLIDAFNKIYKSRETRGIVIKRFIAMILTFIVVIVLLSAILLLVLGQIIVDFVQNYVAYIYDISSYEHLLGRLTQFGIFAVIFLLGISSIYTIAPSVKQRWKFITVGSVVGSILSMLVSGTFSYYLNNFGSYNKVYGSIGALIGIMVWLQMMSWILLVGFQINASIDAIKMKAVKNKNKLDDI